MINDTLQYKIYNADDAHRSCWCMVVEESKIAAAAVQMHMNSAALCLVVAAAAVVLADQD